MELRCAPHLRELARRVAQHEMGHYVAARLLGFRTGDVSLEIIGPINGHRGGADVILAERLLSLEDVRCYLGRRIQVLYAGAFAETLPPRQSPTPKKVNIEEATKILETTENGAEQDFAKARELLRLLRNIQYANNGIDNDSVQKQLDTINNELWQCTVVLVENHADTIIGLAGNLANRVQCTEKKEVLEASYLENIPAVKELVSI
jgi:hypothetical protein